MSGDSYGATYQATSAGYRDAYASTFPDDNNGGCRFGAGDGRAGLGARVGRRVPGYLGRPPLFWRRLGPVPCLRLSVLLRQTSGFSTDSPDRPQPNLCLAAAHLWLFNRLTRPPATQPLSTPFKPQASSG